MDNNKKIQSMSRNNNPLRSSSEQWLQYFKQAKIDLEEINKALLNNVETVDNENIKLKEAIRELISDLQEKEVSLDQSQKIIMKLKEEYTKIITEYQNIETSNQKYEAEIANIKKCNEYTTQYGLILSDDQINNLLERRKETLKETGRIEFREGIIDKLIKEFCDSPYINKENYAETLYELIEMFYEYKNETMDLITDEELIEFMKKSFDGNAQGNLEY